VLQFSSALLFGQQYAPQPIQPTPSARQHAWQEREFIGFVHVSINTYTDQEWGFGNEPPHLFNPSEFNADSVVGMLASAGMKEVILTAKHHSGFCLWPSKWTEYSVKNSPWKSGRGDMVREFSEACRKFGIAFGVYLSPWDRNHKEYGRHEYVDYYFNQLRELLTDYGEIAEVWFDGANGGDGFYGGAREKRIIDRHAYYPWQKIWKLVRELQPNAVIFSDVGPDVRWVGNENGFADETNWSPYSPVGEKNDDATVGYVRAEEATHGHRDGLRWIPAECDVSIRPGWFYHAREDSLVKSLAKLFELYLKSAGRNGVLLLNIPLDRSGLLPSNDTRSLLEFARLRKSVFAHDLAQGSNAIASNVRGGIPEFAAANVVDGNAQTWWASDDSVTTAWIEVRLPSPSILDCVELQEPTVFGQRIESFSVERWTGATWDTIAHGTTVGYKRLVQFPPQTTDRMRIRIERSKACPVISSISIYLVGGSE
jgi:alpha-L-fucosidase